jgi:hypothetical protein
VAPAAPRSRGAGDGAFSDDAGPPPPLPVIREGVGFTDMLRDALAYNRRPTVDDVAAQVAVELAAHRIRSKKVVRLVALSRVDERHLDAIDLARAALDRGDAGEALTTLEKALAAVEPEHLLARIDLLKAMVRAARSTADWKKTGPILARLKAAELAYVELLIEAGRESGQPDEALRALKVHIEQTHERRQDTLKLSGFMRAK